MNSVRMAVIVMTAQRYLGMVVNFVMVAVVSRLLRPEEIGLAVIGSSIGLMLLSGREFAALAFLVQKKNLEKEDIRAAFSVYATMTLLSCAILVVAAPWISAIYETPSPDFHFWKTVAPSLFEIVPAPIAAFLTPDIALSVAYSWTAAIQKEPLLVSYLWVVSGAVSLEIISAPILALMQREMAFARVAFITTLQVVTAAAVTVLFAALGFSTMSYAWSWFISSALVAVLALYFWRDISLFHPTLRRWRDMIAFGGYTGTNVILARFYETVPSLVLGQTAKSAVGFFDRSKTICDLPEKVFLSGFIAVSLPAFSAELRAKNGLKTPYLKALNYITALLWPALVCVAILADPIVAILLGAQWEETVPIVRIVALAWLFTFSSGANFAVLTASGAIKAIFIRALITWPASAVILASCAYFGLKVMALGFFIVVPFQALVAIQAVRKQIPMSWGEITSTLKKSFWVTLFTASGPLAMVALIGFRFDFSILQGILAGLLAGVGWLAGLWMTQHPFLNEIFHVATALRRKPAVQKILGRWS